MSTGDSILRWIEGVKRGDEKAAQALWERYFDKLVRLVRRKLSTQERRVADEEDIALSSFKSFCLAAREGRFPQLSDRHGLWKLLLSMAARKAVDQRRYLNRDKRRVLGESALRRPGDDDGEIGGIEMVAGKEPTPDFAAMVAEEYEQLLSELGDEELIAVALAKLAGYTHEEIARQRDCSLRTIERQLNLIRKRWEKRVVHGQGS